MARKKESQRDATSRRMNEIAQKLLETRNKACSEIAKFGWPIDVYNDPGWYLSAASFKSLPYKQKEYFPEADTIRNSVLEIDFTLAAMNHYAEMYSSEAPTEEVDAVIEALDSAINAIAAFMTPNAMVGERQRSRARQKRRNPDRNMMHRQWVTEDAELLAMNPSSTKSDRAKRIAKKYNKSLRGETKPTTEQTVRSAIRRMHKKLVS